MVLLATSMIALSRPEPRAIAAADGQALKNATFAGGCFWCMASTFDTLDGVVSTTSGDTDGRLENPTYADVSAGGTGHTEAVDVLCDPGQMSDAQLLEVFWRDRDPLARDRQFCDNESQDRSAIFYNDAEQERLAQESKDRLTRSRRFNAPIVTQVAPASVFPAAEGYLQDSSPKNPLRYTRYRYTCGRDTRREEVWGETE